MSDFNGTIALKKGRKGFYMKIIDLTHTITENMPVYPGTDQPSLKIICNHESDGFKETSLTMASHTGTHMDAPNHIFADRTTLDNLPVELFIGSALVIDCSDLQQGKEISMDLINAVKEKADQADFFIIFLRDGTNTGAHLLISVTIHI